MVEEYLAVVVVMRVAEQSSRPHEVWTLPSQGWLKVNMDAPYKDGKVALGVVMRNDKGDPVLVASRTCDCISSEVAKMEAIMWATNIG